MIWGMALKPGEVRTREVGSLEYLTLASLECRPRKNNGELNPFSCLIIKMNGEEHILCTLEKSSLPQQKLDLQVTEAVTFMVEGTGTIYLTGYSQTDIPQLHHEVLSEFNNTHIQNDNEDVDREDCLNAEKRPPSLMSEKSTTSHMSSDDDEMWVLPSDDEEETMAAKQGRTSEREFTDDASADCCDEGTSQQRSVETLTELGANACSSFSSNCQRDMTSQVKRKICNETEGNYSKNQKKKKRKKARLEWNQGMTKKFRCQYCRKSYAKKSGLEDHERIHTGVKPFKCQYCSETFRTKKNVQNHESKSHSVEQANAHENETAELDGSTVGNKSSFVVVDEVMPQSNNALPDRETSYSSEPDDSTLRSDGTSHVNMPNLGSATSRYGLVASADKNESPVIISSDDATGGEEASPLTNTAKEKQTLRDANRIFKCPHCDKVFCRKDRMAEHVRIHTGEKPYNCKFCKMSFRTSKNVRSHEQKTHGNMSVKSLSVNSNSSHSMKKIATAKLTPAVQSSAVEVLKSQTNTSVIVSLSNDNETSAIGLSGRVVKGVTLQNLPCSSQNTVIHSEPKKTWDCNFCSASFKTRSQLWVHLPNHHEEFWSCSHCGKTCHSKGALVIHERIHTGEKPFKCLVCKKAFASKCQLTKHEKTEIHQQKSSKSNMEED